MDENHELYWMQRAIANSAKAFRFADDRLKKLRREYEKAIRAIDRELNDFYRRYAKDGVVDQTEANKRMRGDRSISRLKALREQIERIIDDLFALEQSMAKETLSSVYQDTIYRWEYELQKAAGVGRGVAPLLPRAVEAAISTAWSGQSYSARIWTHRQKLGKKVEQILTQGITLGHSNQRMAADLASAMDVGYRQAVRLVRSETNFVYNNAALQSYQSLGLDQYEYLATLDQRTSDKCAVKDGKRFFVTEAQVGLNYPPLHPNCRSTTIPYIAGLEDLGERIARSSDGSTYRIPGNITYADWRQRFVS